MLGVTLVSCGKTDDTPSNISFMATVLEISGDTVLAEPLEGAAERSSADQISFSGRSIIFPSSKIRIYE